MAKQTTGLLALKRMASAVGHAMSEGDRLSPADVKVFEHLAFFKGMAPARLNCLLAYDASAVAELLFGEVPARETPAPTPKVEAPKPPPVVEVPPVVAPAAPEAAVPPVVAAPPVGNPENVVPSGNPAPESNEQPDEAP